MDKDTQEKYNHYRSNRGGWGGHSRGRFQKSLILTGIQLAEMEYQPDVIYVSWKTDCPDKPVNKSTTNQETVRVQLFAEGVERCFPEQVVSETLNCALLDTDYLSNCVRYQLPAMLCRLIAH